MLDRATLADRFLAGTDWAKARRRTLAGDASARQYQRLFLGDSGETAVLMDAPPEHGEDAQPFVRIAAVLAEAGLSAPAVLASDAANGFLLLEDLGDALFARLLSDDSMMEETLYAAAVDVLARLQNATVPADLVRFTPELMAEQAGLVYASYARGGDETGFCRELETILRENLLGDSVLILRDYHAENLIWLPERSDTARVGLLDFQDAMAGPLGYDLVSLLYDARRDVSPVVVDLMTRRFALAAGLAPAAFGACLAVLCVQRNLRIFGVFARLARERGKPGYIDLMPRVWGHVITALQHPALHRLAAIIHNDLPPPTPEHLNRLRQP